MPLQNWILMFSFLTNIVYRVSSWLGGVGAQLLLFLSSREVHDLEWSRGWLPETKWDSSPSLNNVSEWRSVCAEQHTGHHLLAGGVQEVRSRLQGDVQLVMEGRSEHDIHWLGCRSAQQLLVGRKMYPECQHWPGSSGAYLGWSQVLAQSSQCFSL